MDQTDLLNEFVYFYEAYEQALISITVKKLNIFKSLTKPTRLESNIGLALMLVFSNLDEGIELINDKSTLADKSWSNTLKYFSNSGKVMQNCRKLKETIDTNSNVLYLHIKEIKILIDGSYYTEAEFDQLKDVPGDLYIYVKALIEYYDFIRQAKS
jgi:hypothetical protein